MTTDNSDIGQLVLDGNLTIRNIESVHLKLTDAISRRSQIVIDCRSADEVDVSMVQLLLAARAGAASAGRRLVLAHPADGALLDVLVRGGFLQPAGAQPHPDTSFWLNAETSP